MNQQHLTFWNKKLYKNIDEAREDGATYTTPSSLECSETNKLDYSEVINSLCLMLGIENSEIGISYEAKYIPQKNTRFTLPFINENLSDGCTCPACKGINSIESDSIPIINGNEIYHSVYCSECEAEFSESYKLVSTNLTDCKVNERIKESILEFGSSWVVI